eukprot:TRINITY_DN5587_c0_g1_i1.p1 TRINITY_DN5587_c0_g1~~TRINITY_DN5587_c0_g1_i1.p1  ORF type:complete len:323 (-),score=78.68 TRINITY_DN5587_c0_g1_i1:311-1255(-)
MRQTELFCVPAWLLSLLLLLLLERPWAVEQRAASADKMGAGASAEHKEAFGKASVEELAGFAQGLSPDVREKLAKALDGQAPAEKEKNGDGPDLCLLVTVDIKEDRLQDFLAAMEQDARGSREEAACKRFDLLRNRDKPTQFVFYEVYDNGAAMPTHKETAHYKAWADFKASGGVENQAVAKCATTTIPGGWALQPCTKTASEVQPTSAVLVTVDVKEDRVDDFLKAMEADVTGSRDKGADPGCLRFDLLRNQDKPTQFVFYEAYVDDDAAAHHKTTAHYKAWADFKSTGGVDNQSVVKVECAAIEGGWAFQAN